jgi:hypothetical protein
MTIDTDLDDLLDDPSDDDLARLSDDELLRRAIASVGASTWQRWAVHELHGREETETRHDRTDGA